MHIPESLVIVAYIDPMSGAVLIQLIIAVAVACVAFFRRTIWRWVRFVFRAKRPNEDSQPPEDPKE